jgi:hypothetical protein
MWFLVRLAFWLSLVIVLLPAALSQRKTCASQVGPCDAFSAAAAAVSNMRQFCGPGACASGSQAIVQFEQKAHAGAKMIYQLLNERTAKNVAEVAAKGTNKLMENRSRETLTPADLATPWDGPMVRKRREPPNCIQAGAAEIDWSPRAGFHLAVICANIGDLPLVLICAANHLSRWHHLKKFIQEN